MFNTCSSSKKNPSARCAETANICKDAEVFGTETVSLNHIL
jgi:hypothetical protein